MTAQPASEQPGAVTSEDAPATVVAEAGTRLEQLHAAYATAKAEADEAAARLKAVTDAIKVELTQVEPEARRIELRSSTGAPALRLTYLESWRLDSTRLKREHPETWVAYARKSGSWRLAPVKADSAQGASAE